MQMINPQLVNDFAMGSYGVMWRQALFCLTTLFGSYEVMASTNAAALGDRQVSIHRILSVNFCARFFANIAPLAS